jgi:hypothetical protein
MSEIVLKLKCMNCGNKQNLSLPKGYYFFSTDNYIFFESYDSHIRTKNIFTWKRIDCNKCNINWLERIEVLK